MYNDHTHFRISIFEQRKKWHQLLKNGIGTFLENYGLMNSFKLELHHKEKDGITLIFPVSRTDRTMRKKEYLTYFNGHIFTAPGDGPTQKLNISFKNNNISPLSNGLSQIILQVLSNNNMTDDDLLTFAFYLQMGAVDVMTGIDPDFTNTLKRFLSEDKPSANNTPNDELPFDATIRSMTEEEADAIDNLLIDKLYLNEKFEKNKDTLFEIKEDITNASYQDVPDKFKRLRLKVT